jgi:lipopolysaccharide biosynthesis glycosyltransferase
MGSMKKLVTVTATGIYESIIPFIYPMFERYAKRCNADFIPIEKMDFSASTCLDKIKIGDFFKTYDRIALFDADMVIRPDCPDLFELVPPQYLGAYEELNWFISRSLLDEWQACARAEQIKLMAERWSLQIPKWPEKYIDHRYYNAGLMVFSREHEKILTLPALDPLPSVEDIICPEQVYKNWGIMVYGIEVFNLPVSFNQMPHNRPNNYRDESFIVHYAGIPSFGERVDSMKADVEYWDKIYSGNCINNAC